MRIGPIRLANRLILAPMAGVTDRPFRQLCRRLGAGLAVSEMVAADTGLWGTRKTRRRLDHSDEPGPISVQIVGADPTAMAEAARLNQGLGADIIDINMGCPAKKVCKVAAGSALLRDEALVGRILAAAVAAVDVPVTLKIRTGWAPQERNALRIARIARESGIAALAVHGRTRACGFAGQAEYETLRAIKAEVAIPLIANGDIDSPEKARAVLDYTGADAIMLGRAAQGRPWIFREVAHYLATGARLPTPPAAWIRETLLSHLDGLYGLYGCLAGVRVARKHIAWYCVGQPEGGRLRDSINKAETAEQQKGLIRDWFDRLGARERGTA
jgi:tRNA-dihydrouridine synthase B